MILKLRKKKNLVYFCWLRAQIARTTLKDLTQQLTTQQICLLSSIISRMRWHTEILLLPILCFSVLYCFDLHWVKNKVRYILVTNFISILWFACVHNLYLNTMIKFNRDCVLCYIWQWKVRRKPRELKEELPNWKCINQKHYTKCWSLATDPRGNYRRFLPSRARMSQGIGTVELGKTSL